MKKIPLTKGKYALVDDGDYEKLMQYKWQATVKPLTSYAQSQVHSSDGTKKTLHMHRLIMDAPKDLHVDHINHDGLDNRRNNLRLCTKGENNRNCKVARVNNTSGRKGVSWYPRIKSWVVYISYEGKNINLGYYKDIEEATKVYDNASLKYFGAFAKTNRDSLLVTDEKV